MSEHKITVMGGTSVRLTTAGKYCDRDILVTAEAVEQPTVTAISYANWDYGSFKETLDNGATLEYAVELEDGKPVKVTGPDGSEVEVEPWPDDGGGGGDGASIDTYTQTYSGTTEYNSDAGLAVMSAYAAKTASGDWFITKNIPTPTEVVFNGVAHKVADIFYTANIGITAYFVGNASFVNAAYGTDFADNGLDFVAIYIADIKDGPMIIATKAGQEVVYEHRYKGKRVDTVVYDQEFTATITQARDGNVGTYAIEDFPTGLTGYAAAVVEYDIGKYYNACQYVCELNYSTGGGGFSFGDNNIVSGGWVARGMYTPFYVSVALTGESLTPFESGTIYTAESGAWEHHIVITFRKWEPV